MKMPMAAFGPYNVELATDEAQGIIVGVRSSRRAQMGPSPAHGRSR